MMGTMRAAAMTLLGAVLAATPARAQQTVTLTARDRALTDRPASVFSVGTDEGESWEMFSGIRGLAFDRADNLYVLDGQNTRIVVFDARGRFLRQFGKRGAGPGELQAPLGIAATADGNIVVNDLGNRTLVVFSPTGEYVKNVPYSVDGAVPFGAVQADPRGGIVSRSSLRLTSAEPVTHGSIIRQQLDENIDPITIARFDVPPPRVLTPSSNQRMVISVDPVFSARPSFGVLPDGGIALHHESSYAVRIHDAAGRHTRTLTRAFTPRKVTKRDQEQWEARNRERQGRGSPLTVVVRSTDGGNSVSFGGAAGGGGAGTVTTPVQIDRTFADVMSVVTGIRTDPTGRIWIQRRHDNGSDAGPIDLADSSGRYIGTLPPQPLPSTISASGLAAWVVTDDLGIERVAVRRLPQSWR